MKTVQEKVRTTVEHTTEAMKKCYDQQATRQPDIEIGDWVILNGNNIKSTRATSKFIPGLYKPFKLLEKEGK